MSTVRIQLPVFFLFLLWACTGAPASLAAQDSAEDAIRPLDKVLLKNKKTIEGMIEGAGDPRDAPEIVILTGKGQNIRVKIQKDDYEEIIPRQTAADAYKKKREKVKAVKDRARRAEAELALGIWCRTPLAVLDGAMPQPAAAMEHLFNAVELSPALSEAYPHLIDALSETSASAEEPATIEREVEASLLAERGKVDSPELHFRIGVLLATKLGLPDQARPHLEKVLSGGHDNLGQLRQARALLRDIHEREGAPGKAMEMYQALLTSPENAPQNFEPYYELARLHARSGTAEGRAKARELFAKARAIQPDFLDIPGELAALDCREGNLMAAEKLLKELAAKGGGDLSTLIDLAIVRARVGRFSEAEKSLSALMAQAGGEDAARLHLALGCLREDRGDSQGALAEYEKALQASPGRPEIKVYIAMVLVRLSRAEEARKIAQDLLSASKESRWLFAAASRILAEVELTQGHVEAALEHLARAGAVDALDPALLERVGILLLHAGKLDFAYDFLRRSREAQPSRPATLNALGYYHYRRGEMLVARKLFEQVIGLVPQPRATGKAGPPPVPPERAYALRARDLVDDMESLQVWSADFKGPDGPTLGGWQEIERYGIEIARKGSLVVLEGKQAGAPDGVTTAMLERPVEGGSFERMSMTARVNSGKVRLALRLEGVSARGGASAGLIFYRDFDGIMRFQVKTTQGDWEAGVPTPEKTPPTSVTASAKLVYPGTAAWGDEKAFHTLEIRRSGKRTGTRPSGMYDLHLDGEPVAWNVKIGGLTGRLYEVGFSSQTDALGNEFSVSVESFKIYRARPTMQKRTRY